MVYHLLIIIPNHPPGATGPVEALQPGGGGLESRQDCAVRTGKPWENPWDHGKNPKKTMGKPWFHDGRLRGRAIEEENVVK